MNMVSILIKFTKNKFLQYITVGLLVVSTQVLADAVIVTKAMNAATIAEIYIEKNHIRVELEIGYDDLKSFKNIMPDVIYAKLTAKNRAWDKRIKDFFKNDFVIKADGKKLEGMIVRIKPGIRIKRDEITGATLKSNKNKSKSVIKAVLQYFYKGKPSQLSITPPSDPTGISNGTIGFVAYHTGIAINDFRYLSKQVTLKLDWNDPWYSKFQQRNLWRKFEKPIAAFIYVEPFEVRKEIVIRPKDIQKYWLDIGIGNKQYISIEDQHRIKQKVANYLLDKNPVLIDGKKVPPMLDRIHFIQRSLNKTSIVDDKPKLAVDSAMLGIIYKYPTTKTPQIVTMQWQLWHRNFKSIMTQAIDEAGSMPYLLTQDEAKLQWQNFLKKPSVISSTVLKPPNFYLQKKPLFWGFKNPFVKTLIVSNNDAKIIMRGLLANIYQAFNYPDEEATYDVLNNSVIGKLLTKIYLDTRKSLILKNQGGVKIKVKNIEIISAKTKPLKNDIGFTANCTWNVTGTVGHWGHIHQRRNQYKAIITIKSIDNIWKITDLKLLDEMRL